MVILFVDWDETPPADFRSGAVSIGNFDGVHRGHRALLTELKRQAECVGGSAVALTFDPPPLWLLRPEQFQPVLTSINDRAEVLMANGADHVLILRTTLSLLDLSAAEFFHRVVRDRLAPRALVEGPNFGFGKNRQGNVALLDSLCQQFGLTIAIVPPLEWNGAIISSSRIRTSLNQGNVREAADLLSRPYRMRGRVGTGQNRGKTIGFPTANLETVESLVPGDGVYAVRVIYQNSHWPGAVNIGPNPTFGEAQRKIEVHLIDFQGDLLGQILELEFVDRLRDTRAFPSLDQLVAQIRLDVERARRLVGVI
ncbi:MAG TPA: bifunctional riboflavin kinase/FAD synthetase [Gemmataceae bacterium]|nr:bifunctional riboflavin kinase/FAD synthetase [Gemmataceae bacterium]